MRQISSVGIVVLGLLLLGPGGLAAQSQTDTKPTSPLETPGTSDLALMELRARQGDVRAMVELGTYHVGGESNRRNYPQGYFWLSRAAQLGSRQGTELLAQLWESGNAGNHDFQIALNGFLFAARKGSPSAPLSIGRIYDNGHLGRPDPLKARAWYEEGARRHEFLPLGALGSLHDLGDLFPRNPGLAWAYYTLALALPQVSNMPLIQAELTRRLGFLERELSPEELAKARSFAQTLGARLGISSTTR